MKLADAYTLACQVMEVIAPYCEQAAIAGSIRRGNKPDVKDIEISRYLPYYKDIFEFKTIAGDLSFGGSFRYRQEGETPRVSLSGMRLDLRTLEVVDEDDDEPLIAVKELRVGDARAALDSR